MRKTIYKLFWAWQSEQEERWLNEMSAKGLQLLETGGVRYTFQEGTPGEYQYRLELLEYLPSHPESQQYIRFMEETGAELVGSTLRWVYFRKRVSDGPFELFSDVDSKLRHLRRIHTLLLVCTILELMFGMTSLLRWFSTGYAEMLGVCIPLLLLGGLLLSGVIRISRKITRMKREGRIHE